MSKTVESRLDALEKDVEYIKKVLDSVKRLSDTKSVMTPAEMGRKGGKATGRKGMAAVDPERRAEIMAKVRAAKAAKRSEK